MKNIVKCVMTLLVVVLFSGCGPGVTVLKEPVKPILSASRVFVHTDTTIVLPWEENAPPLIGVPIQFQRFQLSDFDNLLSDALKKRGFIPVSSKSEADLIMLIRAKDWQIDVWDHAGLSSWWRVKIFNMADYRGSGPQETQKIFLGAATFQATFLDGKGNELCIIENDIRFRNGDPLSHSEDAPWGVANGFAKYTQKVFGTK
jgi:hypothetical protein